MYRCHCKFHWWNDCAIKKRNIIGKQRFIHYVAGKLERAGCSTDHAKEDADVIIVQTAVASARTKETIIIADGTDLLILLG